MKKFSFATMVLFQFVLSGCASDAWNKYPIQTKPDYTCLFGGGEVSERFFIWKCLDGKRVVIKQKRAFLGDLPASKYEASWGDKTELENDNYANLDPGQSECANHLDWSVRPN